MQVFVDGNIVKAARITGPEHHFLGVEFSSQPSQVEFIDCSKVLPSEKSQQRKKILLKIISDNSDTHLNGGFLGKIKSVMFDSRDTVNEAAYRELFKHILEKAESIIKEN